MNKKKLVRALSMSLCAVMALPVAAPLASCGGDGGGKKKASITIMTEELSGLFNPFYATAGADMDVVGMTQIGMLSTDSNGSPVAGDDLPTVAKAFKYEQKGSGDDAETVYTFVIKNGLKFSDGEPLTMNDVLFNMYEYLDPVYTGSSTMYSIDIKGLSQYRTQTNYSSGSSDVDAELSNQAAAYAKLRIMELVNLYEEQGLVEGSTSSYSMSEAQMEAAIKEWPVSDGYKLAVASNKEQLTMTEEDYQALLLEDYKFTLKTFKEELESDYKAAKESFDTTTVPYSDWKEELSSDIFKFFLYEGYITPEYRKVQGKVDKTKIEKFNGTEIVKSYDTQEKAINRVYNDNVKSSLNVILTGWGTAGTLATEYSAAAIDVLLHNNMSDDGELLYPNIEGIVSLGHTTQEDSVEINGVTYKVAHEHNAKGEPVNPNEYDVLQITVNGTDPKAIYNFGFTVAPAHYYTADSEYPNGRPIDIAGNKFGVEFASNDFQSKVIKSQQHVKVPVGAGAFQATDKDDNSNPKGEEFVKSNIVYFKKNENFMFDVKADRLRLQVVSASNAIDKLEKGEIDYITPQFTKANADRLKDMTKKGFTQLDSWQLGYGYIGINAGKVPNVYIRRAIMAAMQTSLALEFYQTGTCKTIDWPMSTVSWAYPFEDDGVTSKPNGHTYTQWTGRDAAKAKIEELMKQAGVQAGDSQLSIKFTIAGASITEHPTYPVFKQASEILNEMGWNIDVDADSQALTKLSQGALAVWAAAWGSTIDPDMYQVYHKNSKATSVFAWGYREIKADTATYSYEMGVINQLSNIIDDARSIMDQKQRTAMYEEAMGLVLDLAVEMPVYQRKTLYAYNNKTIKGLTNTVNPYTSPLEKIWEVELA